MFLNSLLQIQKPDPKAFLKFSFLSPRTPPSFGHRVLESTVNPLLGGGAKEETLTKGRDNFYLVKNEVNCK